MRILLFSNYFPPHARGGYEQWAAEVAVELQRRGHTVEVVTARERGNRDTPYLGIQVHRVLNLEAQEGMWETAFRSFVQRGQLEQQNLIQLRTLIEQTCPDVAFIWGMWNVPRSIPALVESLLSSRVVYYFCDYWPTLPSAYQQYWETPSGHRFTRIAKYLIGQLALKQLARNPLPALKWQHSYCVSAAVCDRLIQSGIPLNHPRVIYGGTQTEDFETAAAIRSERVQNDPLRILYAGRLTFDKGVHTVLQALDEFARGSVILTICGDPNSSYARELLTFAKERGLTKHIIFNGNVPRSEIPRIMAEHDVLIFPSIWEEPFARTVLEGMAAGLAVIGTTTGGTPEILNHNLTGLTFPPGDAAVLAHQIQTLLDNPDLASALASSGRDLVKKTFRFDQMVDALESGLEAVVTAATIPTL
ncbi:MAG: glycosyltransferase family 4 protein [Anaerolineae bacterium]|nr:glycosyltransferase family 4 protein [Anaerolineae bacterium]